MSGPRPTYNRFYSARDRQAERERFAKEAAEKKAMEMNTNNFPMLGGKRTSAKVAPLPPPGDSSFATLASDWKAQDEHEALKERAARAVAERNAMDNTVGLRVASLRYKLEERRTERMMYDYDADYSSEEDQAPSRPGNPLFSLTDNKTDWKRTEKKLVKSKSDISDAEMVRRDAAWHAMCDDQEDDVELNSRIAETHRRYL